MSLYKLKIKFIKEKKTYSFVYGEHVSNSRALSSGNRKNTFKCERSIKSRTFVIDIFYINQINTVLTTFSPNSFRNRFYSATIFHCVRIQMKFSSVSRGSREVVQPNQLSHHHFSWLWAIITVGTFFLWAQRKKRHSNYDFKSSVVVWKSKFDVRVPLVVHPARCIERDVKSTTGHVSPFHAILSEWKKKGKESNNIILSSVKTGSRSIVTNDKSSKLRFVQYHIFDTVWSPVSLF